MKKALFAGMSKNIPITQQANKNQVPLSKKDLQAHSAPLKQSRLMHHFAVTKTVLIIKIASILKQIIMQLKKHSSMRQSLEVKDNVSQVSCSTSISAGGAVYKEMQRFIKLITKMAEDNVDIRRLHFLRLSFGSGKESSADTVTYQHFLKQCGLMKELLLVINTESSQVTEDISLSRLSLLIDLYHYFPVFRKQDRNLSTELYYILSSNKKGQALDLGQ